MMKVLCPNGSARRTSGAAGPFSTKSICGRSDGGSHRYPLRRPASPGTSPTFQLLKAPDQIGGIDFERYCQPDNVLQRRISLSCFQTADVGSVDPRSQCEGLLRKALLQTPDPNPVTKLTLSGGWSFARSGHITITRPLLVGVDRIGVTFPHRFDDLMDVIQTVYEQSAVLNSLRGAERKE